MAKFDEESVLLEDTQKDKYLTFLIDKEVFGLDIKNVTEIIGIQIITEVPDTPNFIRGIINLRGKIIPVMDVRLRFKKQFLEYSDRTCIIVINIWEVTVGLIVDSVAEVVDIPEENIENPPKIKNHHNRYIRAVGKIGQEVTLLLDCEKLLEEELEMLGNLT